MSDLEEVINRKSQEFNVETIREMFPVLSQEVNGKPLVYLDNAATTQKPKQVMDALTRYYKIDNSNIHRGAHTLAARATPAFEKTREMAASFIGAKEQEEVIFTKGTTESINLVASSYGKKFLQPGDEVLISTMEHHSNIVPWQMLSQQTGAVLKVIPIHQNGEIIWSEFKKLLTDKTKIVSVVHASNALGTINPVNDIISEAHKKGAVVFLDAAQSTAHLEINVEDLDCDFMAFSAHKLYGPTGLGVLYGKRALLEAMPPYQGGGEMIKEVDFEGTTYNDIPYKFEAGTPNIADVIAFQEALRFIHSVGKHNIHQHESYLLAYAMDRLSGINGFVPIGTAKQKVSVLSFLIKNMHPFDVGMMLDASGIAVRTGHHCTQPLMKWYGIEGTARASFAVYNTIEEVDRLHDSLARIAKRKN